MGLRVVVTGATGNVGTSLLEALEADPAVDRVVGLASREPAVELSARFPKVSWHQADVGQPGDDLTGLFRGADAVVHLAWVIQPSHDLDRLWQTNVRGTRRVLEAVAGAGVPALVHASSVGAYSAGPKDQAVDEHWPTDGVATSAYSREKAYVERLLDVFELEHPAARVVRLRPALIFKDLAASEIGRYFLGRLLPQRLVGRGLPPIVPRLARLRFQAVHSLDAGAAYHLAVTGQVRGPFNLAADPVIDPALLAEVLGARQVPLPLPLVRAATDVSWRLRLQPTPAGWLDLATRVPILDTTRARRELGWTPRHSAADALEELIQGMQAGAGTSASPPLRPAG